MEKWCALLISKTKKLLREAGTIIKMKRPGTMFPIKKKDLAICRLSWPASRFRLEDECRCSGRLLMTNPQGSR